MKFNFVLIGSEHPEKLVEFYTQVFQRKPDWSDSGYNGWQLGESMVTFGPHDKVKGKATQPERILIGFEVEKVEPEFERIEKLGATVIAEPYHPGAADEMTIATFADPDGNYFQLGTPVKM